MKYLNWLPETIKVTESTAEQLWASFEKSVQRMFASEGRYEQATYVTPALYAALKRIVADDTKKPRSQSELFVMASELLNAEKAAEEPPLEARAAYPCAFSELLLCLAADEITSPETPASHPERQDPAWLEQAASCQPQSAHSPSAGES